jgi:hypothetical protein
MLAARTAMKQLALVLGVAACGKKAPPEPFKGPLTVDVVMSAKDVVHINDGWDDAYVHLQAKVGAPTKIEGDKYSWAAMAGDDCAYFEVKKAGANVGSLSYPQTYKKDGAIMNRAECLELVGKGPAPEDPNAPGPAEINQVKDFLANAVKARSKWNGKAVKITGTAEQGGSFVVLVDSTDKKQSVTAHMKDSAVNGAMALALGKPATVTCMVSIQPAVNGAGEPIFAVHVDDCTL